MLSKRKPAATSPSLSHLKLVSEESVVRTVELQAPAPEEVAEGVGLFRAHPAQQLARATADHVDAQGGVLLLPGVDERGRDLLPLGRVHVELGTAARSARAGGRHG